MPECLANICWASTGCSWSLQTDSLKLPQNHLVLHTCPERPASKLKEFARDVLLSGKSSCSACSSSGSGDVSPCSQSQLAQAAEQATGQVPASGPARHCSPADPPGTSTRPLAPERPPAEPSSKESAQQPPAGKLMCSVLLSTPHVQLLTMTCPSPVCLLLHPLEGTFEHRVLLGLPLLHKPRMHTLLLPPTTTTPPTLTLLHSPAFDLAAHAQCTE